MKRKYLVIISLAMFIVFLLLYLTNNVNSIDNIFYKLIISIKSDTTTNLMKFITFFGSTKFILSLMIVLFIFYFVKKNKMYIIINFLILGEALINNIIKIIIGRERPSLINMVTETTYSFPSGHTMVAVTLYGFVMYLIMKSNLDKKIKYIFNLCLSLLILLIIISRIYLGAHYFSDVIAGLFLAFAYLLLCIDILERKNLV